jgi:hypothetical protein
LGKSERVKLREGGKERGGRIRESERAGGEVGKECLLKGESV